MILLLLPSILNNMDFLTHTEGWKWFRRVASDIPKVERLINQAKTSTNKHEPFWKFGYLVPRTHWQAMDIDKKKGNDFWKEAEATEMRQLLQYNTFIDKGINCIPTSGYKKIRCHMVYDVRHDGWHKARLVAGGHLTDSITLKCILRCWLLKWNKVGCLLG
jgi:hypothetical protein